jgi:hypothetical protein
MLLSAGFTLLALPLSLPSLAQSSTAPSTWYGFHGGGVAKRTFSNEYRAHAVPQPHESNVVVRFRTPYPSNPSLEIVDLREKLPNSFKDEIFATRYWPIEFEWIEGTDDAIVLGQSKLDPLVFSIEKWTFGRPAVPKMTEVTDVDTGDSRRVWRTPKRRSIEKLFEGSLISLGIPGVPSFLVENRAFSPEDNRYLMGVRGQAEIYHLDLENKIATLAAAPDSGEVGTVLVPDLAVEDWQAAIGLVHASAGLVYHLYRVEQRSASHIYLIDSNSDGILDNWHRGDPASPTIKFGPLDVEVTARF